MDFRCVKVNDNHDVLGIGRDEGQGGNLYYETGVWCDFIFTAIPEVSNEVTTWAEENNFMRSFLKVVDNTVVAKTLEEVQAEEAE